MRRQVLWFYPKLFFWEKIIGDSIKNDNLNRNCSKPKILGEFKATKPQRLLQENTIGEKNFRELRQCKHDPRWTEEGVLETVCKVLKAGYSEKYWLGDVTEEEQFIDYLIDYLDC